MKVLQVNCVYNSGSTGKITADLHKALLEKGIESVVCYGRGKKTCEPFVYKTCGELYSKLNNLLSRFTGIMYGGCFFSTNKLIKIIKKEKPDIVHLQCINGYFVNIYRLISWLKKNKIKTVLTLHAEFMHTANCGHAFECEKYKTGCGNCEEFKKITKSIFFDNTAMSFKRMKKAFDGFNENLIITSVSPWLKSRGEGSVILGDKKHITVMNGLDTEIFYPHGAKEVREKHELEDKKFVLFVTPSFSREKSHIKGGYYLIELAKMMPNVIFGVIGAKDIGDDLPANIINVGRVDNQDMLAKYYSAADATVLLSKKETFSMILAESLCCGTPLVGFEAGGPESIAVKEYCDFAKYGDLEAVSEKLKKMLSLEKSEKISALAHEKYTKTVMMENTIKVYKELIDEGI